jgi:hypothetical protein
VARNATNKQSLVNLPLVTGAGIGASIFVMLVMFNSGFTFRLVPCQAARTTEEGATKMFDLDRSERKLALKSVPNTVRYYAHETAMSDDNPVKITHDLKAVSRKPEAWAPDKNKSDTVVFHDEASFRPMSDGRGSTAPPCSYETFGTKVNFVPLLADAAEWAQTSRKLLFVLNLSGNFEDPQFT